MTYYVAPLEFPVANETGGIGVPLEIEIEPVGFEIEIEVTQIFEINLEIV